MWLFDFFSSLLPRRRATPAAVPIPPAPIPSRPDLVLTPYLAASDLPVSFADPEQPDQALVHVNDAFCALTGYAREDVLGTNCRFLQGKLTRKQESDTIRAGIDAERYVITRLLNYRRDGRIFDNALQVGQLRDTRGRVRFLFGLQWDVSGTVEELDAGAQVDVRDRTLSPQLRMLERHAQHLVRRSIELAEGAAGVPLVERLVAMSRPYQHPRPAGGIDRTALRGLLEYLLAPYPARDGGSAVRLNGADGTFASDLAGPLALWVHELASASARGGALSGPGGSVVLSWGFPTERGRPMIAFHWRETADETDPDAARFFPFAAANVVGGHGARLMREVTEFVGGRSVTRARAGTVDSVLLLPNDPLPNDRVPTARG